MKSTNEIDEKKKEINRLLLRYANAYNRKHNIKRKARKQERQNKKKSRR
jgi:hypothetical protein